MGAKEQSRLERFTQRSEETTPAVFEVSGSVKWFDPSKGYGFPQLFRMDLPEILLHVTCLRRGGFQTACEGARTVCEVIRSPKGLQAVRICSMDDSRRPIHRRLPQRTHVVVVPESDVGKSGGEVVQPTTRFWLSTRGPQTPDIFVHMELSGDPVLQSSCLAKPCSCVMAWDRTVSWRRN